MSKFGDTLVSLGLAKTEPIIERPVTPDLLEFQKIDITSQQEIASSQMASILSAIERVHLAPTQAETAQHVGGQIINEAFTPSWTAPEDGNNYRQAA